MSSHTQNMIQSMKAGTSATSSSDSTVKAAAEMSNEKYQETLGDFEARVASTPQGEWLETSPEIIKLITRGKGFSSVHGEAVQHLCYKGVLVCEHGNSETIINKMNEPINNRLHGSAEARVISGG